MIINRNIPALNTLHKLNKNNKSSASSMEKLSSGLRINKAGDDSAGLAISEKMKAQIRGIQQAQKNTQDGISLIQTAEGGLESIQDPRLLRLKELAVQSANDTLTDGDRQLIQKEVNQLKKGINEIANNTMFNTLPLLNKEFSDINNNNSNIPVTDTKITTTISYKALYNIVENLNDNLEININGTPMEVKINAGNYTAENFISTINNAFAHSSINLTAGFSKNTNNVEFTSLDKSLIFDSIKGDLGADFFAPTISGYNKTGGITLDGFPTLNPDITIISGVNDNLTFEIDSTAYSITINPGKYTIDRQSTPLNQNSPFLNELNTKFIAAGVPVTAQFLYLRDGPPLDGTVLRLKAFSDKDKSKSLSEGNHTFGKFGGNAKDSLFKNILDIWTLIDSSTVKSGSVNVANAKVQGRVELSNGLKITSGKNDALNFKIGGVLQSISLNTGIYNANQLIDEINTQLSNKSINASVQLNMSNHLELIASNYGDLIDAIFGNALEDLFYSVENVLFNINQADNNPGQDSNDTDKREQDDGIVKLQIGANRNQNFAIELSAVHTKALGIDDIDFSTREDSKSAISQIDKAMETISSNRSKFGAYQNSLEHTLNNLSNYEVNLTSAESRIRDTDIAKQMMNMTKSQLLSQASQAMFSQANQKPQQIMQLIGG